MAGDPPKLSLCTKHECVFITAECPACQEADAADIQRCDLEAEIDRLKLEVEDLQTRLADIKNRL